MAVDWITLGAAIVDNSKSQKVQEDCLTLELTLIADACLHYDMLVCVVCSLSIRNIQKFFNICYHTDWVFGHMVVCILC